MARGYFLSSLVTLSGAFALFLGSADRMEAQALIADFEIHEGFTGGQTASGKAGWNSVVGSNYIVVDDYAHSGSQSLRVTEGGSGRLDSPELMLEGYTGVSIWFSNPETTFQSSNSFARFRVVLGETGTPEQRVLEFTFLYPSTENQRYGIKYRNWAGGNTTATATHFFSDTILKPNDWSEFRLMANLTDLTYSVWISNQQILSGIPLGGTVDGDSRISGLQFWGHGNAGGTSYAYYDQITGITQIPEAASLPVMTGMIYLAWFAFARSTRKAI